MVILPIYFEQLVFYTKGAIKRSILFEGRFTKPAPGYLTKLVTIYHQWKSEDAMNAALVLTVLVLIRLVIPLCLLLILGTAINRRQVRIL